MFLSQRQSLPFCGKADRIFVFVFVLGSGLRLSRRGQTGNDEVNTADRNIGHVLDGRLDVLLHLLGHSRDACAKGRHNFQSDLCRAIPHLYGDG